MKFKRRVTERDWVKAIVRRLRSELKGKERERAQLRVTTKINRREEGEESAVSKAKS